MRVDGVRERWTDHPREMTSITPNDLLADVAEGSGTHTWAFVYFFETCTAGSTNPGLMPDCIPISSVRRDRRSV